MRLLCLFRLMHNYGSLSLSLQPHEAEFDVGLEFHSS